MTYHQRFTIGTDYGFKQAQAAVRRHVELHKKIITFVDQHVPGSITNIEYDDSGNFEVSYEIYSGRYNPPDSCLQYCLLEDVFYPAEYVKRKAAENEMKRLADEELEVQAKHKSDPHKLKEAHDTSNHTRNEIMSDSKLNLKIDNTRTLFFNDVKCDYIKFIKVWKAFRGVVKPEHHLMYALLRGHDPYECFAPLTSERHLRAHRSYAGHTDPYLALTDAMITIRAAIRAEQMGDHKTSDNMKIHSKSYIALMKPFAGAITKDQMYTMNDILSVAVN